MAGRANASNPLVDAMSARLYERIPKAVFAAVALSLAGKILDCDAGGVKAQQWVLDEWDNLYRAGIVPQLPPPTEQRDAAVFGAAPPAKCSCGYAPKVQRSGAWFWFSCSCGKTGPKCRTLDTAVVRWNAAV